MLDRKAYALRRPQLVSNDPTSNNLLREIKLLQALAHTDIPRSRLVLACEDAEVIGAPFELLEWHQGFAAKDPLPSDFEDPAARCKVAYELVDALAAISNADWKTAGPEGFGKPDGFLERQVERWLSQLERYKVRDTPGAWTGWHNGCARTRRKCSAPRWCTATTRIYVQLALEKPL